MEICSYFSIIYIDLFENVIIVVRRKSVVFIRRVRIYSAGDARRKCGGNMAPRCSSKAAQSASSSVAAAISHTLAPESTIATENAHPRGSVRRIYSCSHPFQRMTRWKSSPSPQTLSKDLRGSAWRFRQVRRNQRRLIHLDQRQRRRVRWLLATPSPPRPPPPRRSR